MVSSIKPVSLCLILMLAHTLYATDVGGLIDTDTTWNSAGSPYHVKSTAGGSIIVTGNATLTIDPNVVITFEPGLALLVGSSVWGPGTLVARGTEESPIVFTSSKDPDDTQDPAAGGDWSRIHFTDYATDAVYILYYDPYGNPDWNHPGNGYSEGSIIEHAIVEYAGFGNFAAVFAEKSSPYLNHCEIRLNSFHGIQVDGSHNLPSNIQHCNVWNNSKRGVYIEYGLDHRLVYNHVHDNLDGGIYLKSADFNQLVGNTITGNSSAASGGGIYLSQSDYSNIAANVVTANTANTDGGGIHCTLSNHTTFSQNTINNNHAKDDGGGIYVDNHSQDNLFAKNVIQDNTADDDGGGFYFYNMSHNNTLTQNTIRQNTATDNGGALFLTDSDNYTLSANTITHNHCAPNQAGGIYVTTGSSWLSLAGDPNTATCNIIWGNDSYQIYNNNSFNQNGSLDVDARYVQWGLNNFNDILVANYDFFDNSTKAIVVSKPFICPGDFNTDGAVNLLDFSIIAHQWLNDICLGPTWCSGADLDLNHIVELPDLATVCQNWLMVTFQP